MTGAANHKGSSKQDYETPIEFIETVERKYGPMDWDLAATPEKAKAPQFITPERDSFRVRWSDLPGRNRWLNPPYGNIPPWAAKCAEDRTSQQRTFFLVPASVDTNWFCDDVLPYALVRPLRGRRLCFDGVDDFPKPLMLCIFGEPTGFEPWRWRDDLMAHRQPSLFGPEVMA